MPESCETTEDWVIEPELFVGTIKGWDEYDRQTKAYMVAIDASVFCFCRKVL